MEHVRMELTIFIIIFNKLKILWLILSYYDRILIANVNSLCLFTIIKELLLIIGELSLGLFIFIILT